MEASLNGERASPWATTGYSAPTGGLSLACARARIPRTNQPWPGQRPPTGGLTTVIILSGALLAIAAVLWVIGAFGPSACVYASLAVTLFAAGMLPLGAARRVRRGHGPAV